VGRLSSTGVFCRSSCWRFHFWCSRGVIGRSGFLAVYLAGWWWQFRDHGMSILRRFRTARRGLNHVLVLGLFAAVAIPVDPARLRCCSGCS
jgi:hypothetical protein